MRISTMEDSLSFLTPTGELPLIPLHPIFIKRPVQLWLAQIASLPWTPSLSHSLLDQLHITIDQQ